MSFLGREIQRGISRGIGRGIGQALGNAVEQAVAPAANQVARQTVAPAANQAAQSINQTVQELDLAAARAQQVQDPPAAGRETSAPAAPPGSSLGSLFANLQGAVQSAANEAAKNWKLCPACGEPAGADKTFCPSCGALLPEQTAAERAAQLRDHGVIILLPAVQMVGVAQPAEDAFLHADSVPRRRQVKGLALVFEHHRAVELLAQ